MRNWCAAVIRFIEREDGPTAVEYAVMLALIIVVCLAAITTLGQNANGTFNNVFADSGYGDPAHQGTIYASNNLNLAMPGWHAVDAGLIAREVLPLT